MGKHEGRKDEKDKSEEGRRRKEGRKIGRHEGRKEGRERQITERNEK